MRVDIIYREGSLVILMDKQGRIWLTKRTKYRHTSRTRKWRTLGIRAKGESVRYIPIKQLS